MGDEIKMGFREIEWGSGFTWLRIGTAGELL
jgi:hypothetical protein